MIGGLFPAAAWSVMFRYRPPRHHFLSSLSRGKAGAVEPAFQAE
jgi:hypothetical protein